MLWQAARQRQPLGTKPEPQGEREDTYPHPRPRYEGWSSVRGPMKTLIPRLSAITSTRHAWQY
jgi:hypothetical protein